MAAHFSPVMIVGALVLPEVELHLQMLFASDQVPLSPRSRLLIEDMRAEWQELDRRIEAFDEEFAEQARTEEAARLLTTIPGIGPLNATALIAAIGKAETFTRARDLPAWLGLVPKQVTAGGKPKLLGISKRGNVYLRKMLIHAPVPRYRPSRRGRPIWAGGCAV